MLIPYGTDAPVYHFPFATIGLMVANTAIFLGTTAFISTDVEWLAIRWLTLQFNTIDPGQWLTHNFMHADFMHLIGNLFFLWSFGLIVEGKIGWERFLIVYLAIGVVEGAAVQTVMYLYSDGQGSALGASGAIFGILAIALLWAPKNDMDCFLLMGMFSRTIEIPVVGVALFYLFVQIAYFATGGFAMSSEALHLTGFFIGAPIGYLMLKRKWVDCEGWDFLSVYTLSSEQRIRMRNPREQQKAEQLREERQAQKDANDRVLTAMEQALREKKQDAAVAIYTKHVDLFPHGKGLSDRTLLQLTNAMQQQKKWTESIPLMVMLLGRIPPDKAILLRIKLAQVLVFHTDQPRQAAAVLKKLPAELPPETAKLRQQLTRTLQQKLAEGSLESEIRNW